jgi:tetrahydromethanopterin S-methyltransferase subunit A
MDQNMIVVPRADALRVVRDAFTQATSATKCHGCGCLLHTIEALEQAAHMASELAPVLESARRVLTPKKYECLGCEICYPAVAANAFSEAFPDAMPEGAMCPTETPEERRGWPPLPGEYSVVRYTASVAVCTLNSEQLATELAKCAPEGLAIVGTMHTENLGIERVIRNVLANPNIRFLFLCGEDTRQLIGHLPGQSMENLFANGLDERNRIVGAKGKRPFLKNVSPEQIQVFREQVQLVSMIGEQDLASIIRKIIDRHSEALPPFSGALCNFAVETVHAMEPQFYKSDPAGFFVVYPDVRTKQLVVEHYTNAGVLGCVVEGPTSTAVYAEIVKRELVSQLDHAAYLGRELATAERCLRTGEPYIQDKAPGEPMPVKEPIKADNCDAGCTSCH